MSETTSKSLTISQVAVELGVSAATVSMAFSGKGTLTPSRREAVLKAARELGYAPNPLAQRLRGGRAQNTIAFFSPDLDPAGTVFRVQHLQKWFFERGFDVQLHAKPSYVGSRDVRVEMLRTLRQEKPRALVCQAGWDFGEAEIEEVQRFVDEGGEAVCLSFAQPVEAPCDQVIFDSGASYRDVIAHLKELGHQKIGLAGHQTGPDSNARREFQTALEEAGLPFEPEFVIVHPKVFFSEAGALAAQSFLEMKRRPTAMIVNADEAACSFLNQVRRAGIEVPRDLSLVTTNDMPMARFAGVALSAASEPYGAHAQRAAELLMERLNGESGPPRREWVRGHFTPRESTAPLRAR